MSSIGSDDRGELLASFRCQFPIFGTHTLKGGIKGKVSVTRNRIRKKTENRKQNKDRQSTLSVNDLFTSIFKYLQGSC